MDNSSSRVGKDNRGQERNDAAKRRHGDAARKAEDSEETLEVGGALRLRLEAEDRGQKSEIRGQKTEDSEETLEIGDCGFEI